MDTCKDKQDLSSVAQQELSKDQLHAVYKSIVARLNQAASNISPQTGAGKSGDQQSDSKAKRSRDCTISREPARSMLATMALPKPSTESSPKKQQQSSRRQHIKLSASASANFDVGKAAASSEGHQQITAHVKDRAARHNAPFQSSARGPATNDTFASGMSDTDISATASSATASSASDSSPSPPPAKRSRRLESPFNAQQVKRATAKHSWAADALAAVMQASPVAVTRRSWFPAQRKSYESASARPPSPHGTSPARWAEMVIHVRPSRSPAKHSRPPGNHSSSPVMRHRRYPDRHSRSPERHSRSPERHIRSLARHSTSSAVHSRSPARRIRSSASQRRYPDRHSRIPERHIRSLEMHSTSSAMHSRSPARRARSSASQRRYPNRHSMSSERHSRSPAREHQAQYMDHWIGSKHKGAAMHWATNDESPGVEAVQQGWELGEDRKTFGPSISKPSQYKNFCMSLTGSVDCLCMSRNTFAFSISVQHRSGLFVTISASSVSLLQHQTQNGLLSTTINQDAIAQLSLRANHKMWSCASRQ